MVNTFLSHKRRKVLPTVRTLPKGQVSRSLDPNERPLQRHGPTDSESSGRTPVTQRLMFVMKHQEGLTCEESPTTSEQPVARSRRTLFRVVEKLRQEFRSPGIPISEGSNARLSEIP
jgi:DNA-directed RNA polymerase specialized sigma24 family protein